MNILRHDQSQDPSLQAWNAADELLVDWAQDQNPASKPTLLYHDRFGYLTCKLSDANPSPILFQKTQSIAINLNAKANGTTPPEPVSILKSPKSPASIALIKVPKSVDLFAHYLYHLHQNSTSDLKVAAGFMTRHFNSSLIKVAESFFEEVTQSKAKKKARLLLLSGKKPLPEMDILKEIAFKGKSFKQYLGAFSGSHIDYATQFLIDHMEVQENHENILDLGSGNGVIAKQIQEINPNSTLHLVEDSLLAHESGKLNLEGNTIRHHWQNTLKGFEPNSMDLVVTNPPFHFEHEINIQISLNLFRESANILRPGGELQLVYNQHLNYITHLKNIFPLVQILGDNGKFVVARCKK